MTSGKPFTGTFRLDEETKNTVRYAEEAEGRRPVVSTVYVDKYELPNPHPKRIRVRVEPLELSQPRHSERWPRRAGACAFDLPLRCGCQRSTKRSRTVG